MHETCVQCFKNNQIITASRRITASQEMTMHERFNMTSLIINSSRLCSSHNLMRKLVHVKFQLVCPFPYKESFLRGSITKWVMKQEYGMAPLFTLWENWRYSSKSVTSDVHTTIKFNHFHKNFLKSHIMSKIEDIKASWLKPTVKNL